MPSPLFISFKQQISVLKTSLIAERRDDFRYTAADHQRALGFRLLASAHLEHFLESRCAETAAIAATEHRKRRPTRASKCLLVWNAVSSQSPIPVENSEYMSSDSIDKAIERYRNLVSKNHGINGSKLKGLLIPLGFRNGDLDKHAQLFDRLDSVADNRNPAAHTRVNRARQLVEPQEEWLVIDNLMSLLVELDEALDCACQPIA
ncbi:hypothetical protein [Nocardia sp. bgisy134]|uniref:hypothetical protein n=1 Tax=Nocardia sp. bgisy134 TaxID=3413789 RepID=UPI003D759E32